MAQLVRIRGTILVLLSMLAVLVWQPVAARSFDEVIGNALGVAGHSGLYLTVRFVDVGQGDAIHLMTPDGFEMLIDGGPSPTVLRELAYDRSFFDKYIDVVVATHPDTDHVAGLVDVLARYEVGMIVETAVEHEASAAWAFEEAASASGARRITAQAGQIIQLGASTTVRILSPYGDTTDWEDNTASVVVQVIYGDTEFMFTGDAPSSIEEYLVDSTIEVESEVLKLGHHGSKTSSSKVFLDAVHPEYAVVSAGKNNRYGHPHEEVMTRASEAGARLVSTAEQGTLTFESNGQKVWMK